MDLDSSGPRFSWHRKLGDRITLRRKLDRVLWNMEAQLLFPEGKAHILPCTHSDHHPIQFSSADISPPLRKDRPFRFEEVWLLREDYRDIWHQAWNAHPCDILGAINQMATLSKDWNHKTFGNIFYRKKTIQARIVGIQASPRFGSDRGLVKLEVDLVKELNTILKEEVFWFQKSRKEWIRDGDKNTSFYHRATLIRRMLKINGEWTSNTQIIKDHIANYFETLFGRNQTVNSLDSPLESGRSISNRQALSLIRQAPLKSGKLFLL
ncbi:PREDICTED: uncharacterized protein LOC109157174 [Ipomoea nil]|uniref:uncharacterized protein LOC109157174 n=1 Tax=Ipomoea nil TaxID=35883 RepID=UPI0009017AAB|nr:PREDICTED: uncharacterized protein LOC109157174 [Ipomoea nil]